MPIVVMHLFLFGIFIFQMFNSKTMFENKCIILWFNQTYDSCDNRTYQNYIFRTSPIAEEDMKEALKIPLNFNFCMVHEHIPKERLPILYYSGEGEYMLLAFE